MFNRLKGLFGGSREPESLTPEAAVDRCADEFVQLIIRHLRDGKGVHLETAITAAGSIAGYLLLRATGVDLSTLTPGTAVFVEQVNETGPQMVGFLSEVCIREGIHPQTGWTEQIPEEHQPLVPGIDLARDLYQPFTRLADRFGVAEELRPRIACAAAIKLARIGSQALSPELGKALALWSMLSASKTVPHHFAR